MRRQVEEISYFENLVLIPPGGSNPLELTTCKGCNASTVAGFKHDPDLWFSLSVSRRG